MRGMFLRGIDDSRDLGSEQQDSIKSHTHNVSAQNVDTTSAGSHSHSSNTDSAGGHSHPVKDYYYLESSWINRATNHLINNGYDAGSESIGSQGSGVKGADYDNNRLGYINHDTANVSNTVIRLRLIQLEATPTASTLIPYQEAQAVQRHGLKTLAYITS
jgi:hypothetical protein